MNVLKATKRTTTSTGQINKLRSDGFIPAVLYGGKKSNLNISLKKLHLQDLIRTETFMSKVFDLDIDVVVQMDYIQGVHVPTDIYYKGFWNVLFFKPERAEFRLHNTNYLVY